MGEASLKESFRSLYGLVVDGMVSMAISFDDLENIWVFYLRRNLNDWEMEDMCRLLSFLDGFKPNPNVGDGWE